MKKIIFYVGIGIVSITSFLFPLIVSADTIVTSSQISNNTEWTKEGSPYLLTNNLIIDGGAKLVIDPGVVIKSDNTTIDVLGTLVASGTLSEKITLTSYTDDSIGGDSDGNGNIPHDDQTFDARGWYFEAESTGSELHNVDVRYSSDGFSFSSTTAIVDGVHFDHSQRGISSEASSLAITHFSASTTGFAIYLDNNSNSYISSTTIENTYQSNAFSSNHSNFIVSGLKILNSNSYEPIDIMNSTGTMDMIDLENGAQNGIDALDSNISINNATILGFSGSGLRIEDGMTLVSSSTIENNSIGATFQNQKKIGLSMLTSLGNILLNIIGTKAYADDNTTISPLQIENSNISHNSTFGVLNTSASIVFAENNYWGDDSGPFNPDQNQNGLGNAVSSNVSFIPWTKLSALPSCCSNVLFIPGIEASRLYKQSFLHEDQLWEPNISSDVTDMLMDKNGKSINGGIYTRDILKTTNIIPGFGENIYKSFSDSMDTLVRSGSINSWEPIPYDWRYGMQSILSNGIVTATRTIDIEKELGILASSSKTGKVTIVAHSNGGLIAKDLITTLRAEGKASLVDKLVLVASPQLGTAETVPAMLHGDDQELLDGLLLSQPLAREFGQNMPSSYGLLPSQQYFSSQTMTEPLIKFDSSVDAVSNLRKVYGNSISDYTTMNNFLLGTDKRKNPSYPDILSPNVLNTSLMRQAATDHAAIDNFAASSTLKTFQIVGTGLSTTEGTEYFESEACKIDILCLNSSYLDHSNLKTNDGDGVVLAGSASTLSSSTSYFINLQKINEAYGKNYSHSNILEVPSALDALQDIILDDTVTPNEYISLQNDNFAGGTHSIVASVHSPVSIDAYDNKGNHTGIVKTIDPDISYVEENIPNSSYSEEGEGKYIRIQSSSTATTTIQLAGTGIGTFTYDQEIDAPGVTTTSEFSDIPVTDETKAEIVIGNGANASSTLSVDEDGDGLTDLVLQPNTTLSPIDYLTMIEKAIPSFNLSAPIQKTILQRINTLLKLIKKNDYAAVTTKIKLFSVQLSEKKWKSKKLSAADRLALINILNGLLDSLQN
jgi:pimeloyl-ACP methyl ester carboxylesterase